MQLYVIRHGRQESPLCNVDVELSDAGRKQARLLGKRLKHSGIEKLYSSDLIRAVETAEILNQYLHVEHQIFPQLREISFGELEGKHKDVIQSEYHDFLKQRQSMEEDLPYPGGENGEMVAERALPVFLDIAKGNQEKVAIITHGGLIRAVLARILGMDMAKKLMFAKVLENTSITQLDYHRETGRFTVERINDYAHLEKEEALLRKNFVKGF